MKKIYTISTHLTKSISWVVFFVITFLSFSSYAATIRVTSLDDSGTGTLRQAIIDANATTELDEIVFDVSGEILLNDDLPLITESLIIDGSSAPNYDGITPQIIVNKYYIGQSVFKVSQVDTFELIAIKIPNTRGNHYKVEANEVTNAVIRDCDFRNDEAINHSTYGLRFWRGTSAEVVDNNMGNGRVDFSYLTDIVLERNTFTSFITDETDLLDFVGGTGIIKLVEIDANLANTLSIKDNIFENIIERLFYLFECKNFVFSSGSRSNTNIEIPSGIKVGLSIDLSDTENIKIYDVDLTGSFASEYGMGIDLLRTKNTLIDNVTIKNRWNAIKAYQIEDVTIINSDLRDCASDFDNHPTGHPPYAVVLNDVDANLVPNGILMHDNQFGRENHTGFLGGAIYLGSIQNIIISDGVEPNTNITITQPLTNFYNPIAFGFVLDAKIHNINFINVRENDMASVAVKVHDCDRFTFKNNIVKQFNRGIQVSDLDDNALITDNDFRGTGYSGSSAISMRSRMGRASTYIDDNLFGLDGSGDLSSVIFLSGINDLVVSDGSVPNSNVIIQSGLDLPQIFSCEGGKNLTIQNLNIPPVNPNITYLGSNPLSANISEGLLLISNNQIRERGVGLTISLSSFNQINTTCEVSCNTFLGNDTAIDFFAPSTGIDRRIERNNFICNQTAVFSLLTFVNLDNNYWGHSTGPSNSGGYGDSYNVAGGSASTHAATFFSCAPVPNKPVITVEGNGIAIDDNIISVPSVANGTDFGLATDCATTHTFTLKNTGPLPLEVSSIDAVRQVTGSFYVSNAVLPVTLAPNEQTTFDVTFAAQDVGILEARIQITSNDCSGYIFTVRGENELVTSSIEELDKVIPNLEVFNGHFGYDVAVDGNYAVVGHPKDNQEASQAGAVYVYKRQGSIWVQEQKLVADDAQSGDNFGHSVDILGNVIVVGANKVDWSSSRRDIGAVYVFRKTEPNNQNPWTFAWKIQRSFFQSTENQRFGSDVSLSERGLLIGSEGKNNGQGEAYLYKLVDYEQQHIFTPPYAPNSPYSFGEQVSIAENYAAIGAKNEENGFVYIYKYDGTYWTLDTKVTNPNDTHFGKSVSVSNGKIAIGADQKAYIYSLQAGVWTEETSLVPTDVYSSEYGSSLELRENFIAVGDQGNTENSINSGATYLFSYQNNNWIQIQKIRPSTPVADRKFGNAVGFSAGNILIASLGDDVGRTGYGEVGSAYFFGYKTESEKDAGIEVVGNNVSITNNQATTSVSDSTFLGVVTCSDTVNTIYTINSIGTEDLVIEEIDFLDNTRDFRINNLPTFPFTLPAGQSYPLWVTFDAQREGVKETQLNIVVDNCNISDFTFAIGAEKVRDTEAPVLSLPSDTTIYIGTACSILTSQLNLRYATATDNCSQPFVFGNLLPSYEVGTHTINWTAYDANGNYSSGNQTLTIKDTVFPTITAPNDVSTCGGNNVDIGTPIFGDNCSSPVIENDAPTVFPIGVTTVTWTVTDRAGNTSTDTQVVTVTEDNQPPTITAPADITTTAFGTFCFDIVDIGTPIVNDNCGIASIDNDAPFFFDVGTTVVTWTVTDNAGNIATAIQNIIMTETIVPTITAPITVNVDADAGNCTASNVALGTPTTDDNCRVATVTNDAPNVFPIGTTTVTWTVTDNSGNTATDTQEIIVTPVLELTYSATTFTESNPVSGQIENTLSIYSSPCGVFEGTNGEDFVTTGKVTVTNVPAGLTASIIYQNDGELAFNLLGTATSHLNIDDVNDLTVEFNNTAFISNVNTNNVTNFLVDNLQIDFTDATSGGGSSGGVANPVFNLNSTTLSTSQINLSWNIPNGTVTSYNIYRNGILIATLTDGSITSYLDENLSPDVLYYYQVIALNGNATSQPTLTQERTFPAAPNLISVTEICKGEQAIAKVSSTGYIYRLYENEEATIPILETNDATIKLPLVSQSTAFYVSVFSNKRESEKTAIQVVASPTFEAIISGEAERVSCNSSMTLEAQTIDNATYTWFRNGVEVGTGENYQATSSGNYQVRIQRGSCFETSEPIRVILNYAPLATITERNNSSFCESGTISVANSALQTNQDAAYEWLFDNQIIGTENTLTVSQSGTYTLRAIKNGCSTESSIEVKITNLPSNLILEYSTLLFCPNEEVTLTTQSIPNVKYEWYRNGRLIVRNGTNELTTSIAGTYEVKISKNGCELSSEGISIETFGIPTAYLRTSENTLFIEEENGMNEIIASVSWFLNGDIVPTFEGQTTITPEESGLYSAIVTYQTGCQTQTRTVSFRMPDTDGSDVVTGDEDLILTDWNVYPNPSSDGNFIIEFGNSLAEDTQIVIVDATGRIVYSKSFKKGSNKGRIELGRIAQGMYLLKAHSDKQTYIKQLIIN